MPTPFSSTHDAAQRVLRTTANAWRIDAAPARTRAGGMRAQAAPAGGGGRLCPARFGSPLAGYGLAFAY